MAAFGGFTNSAGMPETETKMSLMYCQIDACLNTCLSYDVAVIQLIMSCINNVITTLHNIFCLNL